MTCSRLASFVVATAAVICNVSGLELTSDTWDRHVSEKTVFVKFFAPWCGHCKKIKPDWLRLMSDFAGSPSAVVAEVDCTGPGKSLCERHDIQGYPKLMWGTREKLEVYIGQRTYPAFKEFADSHLGSSCGPGNLALCEESRRARLEKFMRQSPESLEKSLAVAEKQMKSAEMAFAMTERDMGQQIQAAMQKRDKKIKSIKEKQGVPQGPAHGALELTSDNWDEMSTGKTIFVKFFAPWCGHCKAMKHDWERLMTDFEGTLSVLVAEADCAGKGKDLCEEQGVTGFPRLKWGKADDLSVYSGGRTYEELKYFADAHLGKSCGPSNLDLCDAKQKALMEGLADMSAEKREETAKIVEEAIAKAEKKWDDTQWNLTLQIDLAEQEKDKKVQSVKDQGLAEAKEVQAWNKKQPAGFWKPPSTTPPPSVLDDVAFDVAGIQIKNMDLAVVCAVLLALSLGMMAWNRRQSFNGGKICTARHILMGSEEELLKVKARLDAGEEFSALAKECSKCPSAPEGGSLGTRPEGSMSPEMNIVCFDPATKVGKAIGPIKTKFGFHLVVVDDRKGVVEVSDSSAAETRKNK